MELAEKLEILAAGARYDASCGTSGSARQGKVGRSLPAGVCHSFAGDGRCISLLKLLYSNVCRFDCAYCMNRASNDIVRTSFTTEELVRLTISFYRRNYIEGLFLSSGIFADPDIVMERLVAVARALRVDAGFGGYIHLKAIPGCGDRLLREAGLYADRLSANIELPNAASLASLAPDKSGREILGAMRYIGESCEETKEDRKRITSTPGFAPAGQSTQVIVGATQDSDRNILGLAQGLYGRYGLRRVYYSAYLPVRNDSRLPSGSPPLLREHRLYQADWLLRFYGFRAEEILEATGDNLASDLDPKSSWALAHPDFFPVELSRASLGELLRVPGLGAVSAKRIIECRRATRIRPEDLSRLGLVMKRARYFIALYGKRLAGIPEPPELRAFLADRPPLPGAAGGVAREGDLAQPAPGAAGAAALPGGLVAAGGRAARQPGALAAAAVGQLEFAFP
jgi:putative DNA modification/repair radical SAM protein